MGLLVVLLLIQGCFAFDLPKTGCKADLKINNQHYNVSDTIHTGNAFPTDAHYDAFGNLFYVESGRNDNGFYFDIKVLKFQNKRPEKVTGLPEGSSYSIAVDKKDNKVFFGTGEGIFCYNYETQTATPVSESSLKLNMIFVDKDGNKYITESNNGVEELYLLDGNKKIRFSTLEALNELAIDDKNNFYFIKEDKLFVLKSSLSTPVCIGNVSYDGIAQISIHKETVFIASENLMYFHENEMHNMKEVNDVPGKVSAIAFNDVGDFILGIQGKMMKYKKNECYHRGNELKNDQRTIKEIKKII
ncbi:uncharacterized protein LOC126368828 [Pectinophora gossypiella]|uniref:uncharacterized protein LOC126368828 n=1 Tax=Pectinophora gossypiella TaxID=13191 RepID=UPI00214ECDE9|nr:uncharacterized protein LOC126368828 [Pectinophora gossypiella]